MGLTILSENAAPGAVAGPSALRRVVGNRRVLSLVDQAVISATNMATSVVIGRTCAKTELGLYASGLSLILLLTAIQSALIAVPIYDFESADCARRSMRFIRVRRSCSRWRLVAVGMLVFLVAGVVAHGQRGLELRGVLLTLAMVAGADLFSGFCAASFVCGTALRVCAGDRRDAGAWRSW